MKTMVTANQKGGVGKTSTVVHVAFDFFERGLRVAVIDLDTQANASFTLQGHQSGYLASQMFDLDADRLRQWFKGRVDGPAIHLIASDARLADMEKRAVSEAGTSFKANLVALADSGFDVVLVDTAPSLGVGMAAALFAADYVLSPIELEAYSIQGIKKMVTTIANIRKVNAKLKFLGMMASKVDSRNPRQTLDELPVERRHRLRVLVAARRQRQAEAELRAFLIRGRRRHGRGFGRGDSSGTHCFSAPNVRPRTRCFWMAMPMITGGIAAIRPSAAFAP